MFPSRLRHRGTTGCLRQEQGFDIGFDLLEFRLHLVNLLIRPDFTGSEIRFQLGLQVLPLDPEEARQAKDDRQQGAGLDPVCEQRLRRPGHLGGRAGRQQRVDDRRQPAPRQQRHHLDHERPLLPRQRHHGHRGAHGAHGDGVGHVAHPHLHRVPGGGGEPGQRAFTVKRTPSGQGEPSVALNTTTAPAVNGRTVTLTLPAWRAAPPTPWE